MNLNPISLLSIAGSLFVAGFSAHGSPVTDAAKPNIVCIVLDEWGFHEMSGLGHPLIETPSIDRIAGEGMRFTRLLAGSNVCAPTRASLMLGQHTGHTAVRFNRGDTPIRDEDLTIAEMLKPAGYATGGFGKWGIGDRGTTGVPEKQGFDLFFGYYNQTHAHTYYPNYLLRNSVKVPLPGNTGHAFKGETFSQYLIHDEAKTFIRQHAGKSPFFAYLPYTLPHAYYGIPEDDPAYLKFKDRDWDAPQHHKNSNIAPPDEAKRYAAFMSMADRMVGEILALLKETGIDQNTVVFLSGDNGGNPGAFSDKKHPNGFFAPNTDPRTGVTFRGGKGNFYEGGLRIPFLVRWPGKVEAGSTSDHLGYFPDVMPTLAEIAGVRIPESTDGISFLPTLSGEPEKQKKHEYLYWEDDRQVAVRTERWKLIRPKKNAPFSLYDLSNDIGEKQDIAASHPEIVSKLSGYAKQAHQPIRTGKVIDPSAGFKGHGAN
jgi:arylsulfatase A